MWRDVKMTWHETIPENGMCVSTVHSLNGKDFICWRLNNKMKCEYTYFYILPIYTYTALTVSLVFWRSWICLCLYRQSWQWLFFHIDSQGGVFLPSMATIYLHWLWLFLHWNSPCVYLYIDSPDGAYIYIDSHTVPIVYIDSPDSA